MKYMFNNKEINIPDEELDNLIDTLELSMDEAIATWLDDNDYTQNEQVEELTAKAKANGLTGKINQAGDKTKRTKREVVKKEDPDKEMIINMIFEKLSELPNVNIAITNSTKVVEFEYGGESYKVDLIKRRKAKGDK